MSWDSEEWKSKALGARVITFPAEEETERVTIDAVLDRRVWFPGGGLFLLREGDQVVYVGMTGNPLRERLYLAIMNHERWTLEEWKTWTVAMRRSDGYTEDRQAVWRCKTTMQPRYNGHKKARRKEHQTR